MVPRLAPEGTLKSGALAAATQPRRRPRAHLPEGGRQAAKIEPDGAAGTPMYRRILLASDFSAPATAGARLAAALAAPEATLLAVHVSTMPSASAFALPVAGLDPIPALGVSQANREGGLFTPDLDALRTRLHGWIEETGVRNMDGVVVQGDVARTVLGEADHHAADLVVVGARGHSRFEEVLLGSVAREIVRRSRRDVLLAEDRPHAVPPRNVAVSVAFDETDTGALVRARQIADATGASVTLLHVIGAGVQTGAVYGLAHETPPATEDTGWLERGVEKRLQEMNRLHLGGRAQVRLARGHATAEVARLVQETRADLLVIGHHETRLFERLLIGSLPEAVARHPPCPTLVVQTNAQPQQGQERP